MCVCVCECVCVRVSELCSRNQDMTIFSLFLGGQSRGELRKRSPEAVVMVTLVQWIKHQPL